MYVTVKSLPKEIQHILVTVSNYHKSDIEVKHVETISLGDYGAGDGRRAFTILINLETGEYKNYKGSWGGINMFNLDNPVDTDNSVYPMMAGMLVIKGSVGYPMTYATIYAHRDTALLPLESGTKITEKQALILGAIKGLKSGEYRNQRLNELGTRKSDIEELATMGLLKINKAGAVSITTQGKNLASNRTW